MKKVKVGFGVIAGVLVVALFVSVCYTQLVRPILVQRALAKGCAVYTTIVGHEKSGANGSYSPKDTIVFERAFKNAAWLDPRYTDLAQAAAFVALSTSNLGDPQRADTYKAWMLLAGFCT